MYCFTLLLSVLVKLVSWIKISFIIIIIIIIRQKYVGLFLGMVFWCGYCLQGLK